MKKYLNTFSLLSFLIIALSLNVFTQDSAQKLTPEETKERAEVAAFADSFTREYYKTYDLTKVPEFFFVSDYKKRNAISIFTDKFNGELSDQEKFQNYFMFFDSLSISIALKFKEANFDFEKFENEDKEEDAIEIFSKSNAYLFKKHPKAQLLLESKNYSKIASVEDFRQAHQDYQMILQEIRPLLLNNTPEQNRKFATMLVKNRDELFAFLDDFECSKDDCEGFPAKTKMYCYQAFAFYLLLVKDKGQFKIVEVTLPAY